MVVTMHEDIEAFRVWAETQGYLPNADAVMQQPEFMIDSDQLALWALRLLEGFEAEVATRQRERDRQVAELDAWVDEAKRAALAKRAWVEGKLEGYLRAQMETGRLGDKKSLSLPGGRRLQYRKLVVDYQINDEAAFLAWCRARRLVKESWVWGEAKKLFRPAHDCIGAGVIEDVTDERTGEVRASLIPGISVRTREGESFSVKLAGAQPGKEGVA
jgi:hypothetical protein